MNEHEHDERRHQLGAFTLGHLDEDEADVVRAHLDGCAACRAEETTVREARRRAGAKQIARRSRCALLAAAAVVVLAVGGGAWVGRSTAPTPVAAPAPSIPMEPVTLQPAAGSSVQVETADLIDHTWGVELRFKGAGFTEGRVFSAAFKDKQGALAPAGEFLGTGAAEMT